MSENQPSGFSFDPAKFGQMQRELSNSPGFQWRRLIPKGVYKFKTWEEVEEWETKWKRKAAASESL